MGKFGDYFRGAGEILCHSLDFAIKIIGILGLVVGGTVLYEFITDPSKRASPMDLSISVLTYGAIALIVIFVLTVAYYTYMFFKHYPNIPNLKIRKAENGTHCSGRLQINIALDCTNTSPEKTARILSNLSKLIEDEQNG